MKRTPILILILVLGLGELAQARIWIVQSGVTVSGTVADQTGAVIPRGKLMLLNKSTGETRRTVSDDSGHFSLDNVMPGEYILKGEAEGFQPAELAIKVGSKPLKSLKVQMEISISEDVTVSAKASQPELAENNADAVSFNNNLLGAVPTQMQDILPLLSNFFSPAAMESSAQNAPSLIIDGVESGGSIDMPTDAIKTVSINRNPYSAEFRRPGLARLEVTTRAGSSKYYDGDIAFYLRNGSLSARNAFATEKPNINLRLFEGRLGGPLPFVNRTKFFLAATRKSDDETAVVNAITLSGPLVQNVPTFNGTTNLYARVDVKPNKLNTTTLIYSFLDRPARNQAVGGLALAELGYSAVNREQRVQLMNSTAFSPKLINTLSFVFQRRTQRAGNLATKPEIEVTGFFEGGHSQTASSSQETKLHFEDTVVYNYGRQTFRFGVLAPLRFLKVSDASDFGGLFLFSNLSDYAAGHPIEFQITQGNPEASFTQHEAYGFFQDEIGLAKHLNLTLGARYEWQEKVRDHNNFAPRLAVAFAPGNQKTVFRAGAGIFYERLQDKAVRNSILIDGVHTQELVIENPSFPDPFKAGDREVVVPSVWRLAPDLRAPYLFQSSLGLERRLGSLTQLSVEYQSLRGVHLYRPRNINAPFGSDGTLPNPNFLLINQVESSASMRTNALVVGLQGQFIKHFKGMMQYTLSRTNDDTNGILGLPANNYDLQPEWGRSNLDKRHRLNFIGTYSLPWDMKIAGVLAVASGVPFDIITGRDDNGDTVVNDRPPGVTRNTGLGPGYDRLDLRLSKFFSVPTPFHKELRGGKSFHKNLGVNIDAFNFLNHNNLSNVIRNISSPLFGKANISLQQRTIQLSLKYGF